MFKLILKKKENNKNDRYELTKSVKLVDVKGYLQNEYDRANEREDSIKFLENKIEELTKIQIKYDAMLVVQQETQKRIEKQDIQIKELKENKQKLNDDIKLLNSQKIDLRVNAENKLKEKDDEIKELKKQIKELSKPIKKKKGE